MSRFEQLTSRVFSNVEVIIAKKCLNFLKTFQQKNFIRVNMKAFHEINFQAQQKWINDGTMSLIITVGSN